MTGFVPNWRVDLVESHPDLFESPPGHPEFAEGLPECEAGWRSILDVACMRIRAANKMGHGSFRFTQIKQKMGILRIDWAGRLSGRAEAGARVAIDLAIARSACSCEVCGVEGRLHRNGGFLLTRCDEHTAAVPVEVQAGLENMHIVNTVSEGRLSTIACRRYDRLTDSFVDVDPAAFGLRSA
jgi:hypothetical protein